MTQLRPLPETTRKSLAWPVRLTRLGMIAEGVARAFWPFWTVVLVVLGALMLGLHDTLAIELVWTLAVLAIGGAAWTMWRGLRQFRWPSVTAALERLDATLPGRPISALTDEQAIGAGDTASEAVWRVHRARMAERARAARAVDPDLRLAPRDPYALRYVALVVLSVGLLFGSVWRVGSVAEMAPGGVAMAGSGPSWEGWIEPPAHTGLPSIYLADIRGESLTVPEAARVTLRLYGEVGQLTVTETVSGRIGELASASDPNQEFEISRAGRLVIEGPGGRAWDIAVEPDAAPSVRFDGPVSVEASGEMSQPFAAEDDYAVVAGQATATLDVDAVERRHGFVVDPDPRDPIVTDLPLTITGDRAEFTEALIEDFSKHPWAGFPVRMTLTVQDAVGNEGVSEPKELILPGRRFFDPLAKAVIEQRRDLLWSRENARRVAQILRAVSHRPEDVFRSETSYLRLRFTLRRLETMASYGLQAEQQDEIAEALWDLAIQLEEGDLSDALERLRRAQEQLSEAMRDGASDEEIAELMQELREAMQDYMRQLAEQSDPSEQGEQSAENMQEITGDQLQDMLDRIQELMEQGRMAEAQELLNQLQQMMENMQVTQGQGGQGQQSPGEQAMEGLAETLRDQQGLSDEAFRDLQEQFNPDAQAGENQGNQGRNGNQGQGQSHEGQDGQGQGQGQTPGQPGQGGTEGEPNDLAGDLADRQGALRRELERQRGNLPGAGTPEGDAARDALGRAGEAMDDAEDALRRNDLAEALDEQSQAMDALREGMQNLGRAMAQEQQQNQGQQGEAMGNAAPDRRDPLGRNQGTQGQVGTDEGLLQGEDVYRRARDLLDEIRRRSGEAERPEVERDYLRRLLDRF